MLVVPLLADPPGAPASRPTLLLVDRQSLFLAALAQLLAGPPLNAVVECETQSDRVIGRVESTAFDLVLCEIQAAPVAGPEVAAQIAQRGTATRVILLGDQEQEAVLLGSLLCGATGFFTKDAAPEELLQGVEAVLAGHLVLGRSLAVPALTRLAGQATTESLEALRHLSPVERSVLLMLGQAQPIRAIAAARGISQKTVRNHLANIYRKLELRNRSDIIHWSARAGLIELAVEPLVTTSVGS